MGTTSDGGRINWLRLGEKRATGKTPVESSHSLLSSSTDSHSPTIPPPVASKGGSPDVAEV